MPAVALLSLLVESIFILIIINAPCYCFFTNGQLNDKERLYDGNDICRIHSKTQQHCCLYQYDGYLLDYKDDDKDDHSLTEKWKLKIGEFLQPRVCSYTFIISA